jgi:hypothetical protein
MQPSWSGVERTFVNNDAWILSHQSDRLSHSEPLPRGQELIAYLVVEEIITNVNIDNVRKAFPWDESLKIGRHHWSFLE